MLNKQYIKKFLISSIILIFIIININKGISQGNQPKLDVPFEPTHPRVVEAMLKLANVTSNDYLYDLGCGDGRILITAAKKYGVHGIGVDIDPQRIREAKENSENAGTTDQVKFVVGNIMNFDFSNATVVMLYLLNRINLKIRPILFQQLKPGTRIVSHAFNMGFWEPDSVVYHPKARKNKIYLWVVPAPIGGDWFWTTKIPQKNTYWNLRFTQEFQGAIYKLENPKYSISSIGDVNLYGQKLMFETELQIDGKKVKIVFKGIAHNDTIKGTQQWMNSQWDGTYAWEAVRKHVSLVGDWEGGKEISQSSDLEFKLCIRQLNNGTLHADYLSDNFNISDLPFYSWGANIWFEVNGLTYKGFINGNLINGKIKSEESTNSLNWSAYLKH